MKFNWNQTGMPAALVGRLGQKNELAELKTVLHDAGNHVMRSVDAEAMARELLESGRRDVVDMVRDLTTALAQAERDLEAANRRYEHLTAELERRGLRLEEEVSSQHTLEASDSKAAVEQPSQSVGQPADPVAEWEEWDRRFQSLLA